MTVQTSRNTVAASTAATELDSLFVQLCAQLEGWKARVEGNSRVYAGDTEDQYQRLVGSHQRALLLLGTAGIAQAWRSNFALDPDYDVVAQYQPATTAIEALALWVRTSWPKDAQGRPSFKAYNATTGVLEDYYITVNAAQKADFAAKINAIVACFV